MIKTSPLFANAHRLMQRDATIEIPDEFKEPALTLDQLKEQYHSFNKGAYQRAMDSATIEVSPGVVVNAGRAAFTDVQGLLVTTPQSSEIKFRTADNRQVPADYEDLQTLEREIAKKHQALLQQKWAYEAQINACTTKEEVQAINLVYA